MAGLKNGAGINSYLKREVIILSGKFIDSELAINKAWLAEQRRKKGLDGPREIEVVKIEPETEQIEKPKNEKSRIEPPKQVSRKKEKEIPVETDPDKMTKADLELEIKRTELKKKLKEVSLLSIKEDKARGEVVPTELVNSLIREMSEAMKIAYMDGMENYTVVVARQKKMTTAEEAAIKSHFTGLINETLKRQTYVAKRGLKNVVKAYQEIRSKGESK